MSKRHVVLAEYFITDETVLLFIMRDDFAEPEVITIDRTLAEIQEFVMQNFRAEVDDEGRVLRTTGEKVRRLNETAFQDFFGPLVSPLVSPSREGGLRTAEGDIIWMVPYDVLHYLPLHALKVEGRHLIDRNPVCYSPSASLMKYCQLKRSGRRQKALVVGDSRGDLLHAREEAITVARLFGTTPYLGQQATKSQIKEIIRRERRELDVLHFSCHGYFNNAEALKSGILLAPEDAGEAGAPEAERWTLTAEEIFDFEMNADLVTLSACESGVSEQRRGDELIGLTRALIHAGTPSVVVSLWAVNDISTGLLMEQFYNKLRAPGGGDDAYLTKAEALQSAQKYTKDLTARGVIEHCEQRLAELVSAEDWRQVVRYRMEKANMQVIAGDLALAIDTYGEVRSHLGRHADDWAATTLEQLDRKLPALEAKAEDASPTIDYTARPYLRPYYWAPFVLVGDWK